jgi:hypothetical protein
MGIDMDMGRRIGTRGLLFVIYSCCLYLYGIEAWIEVSSGAPSYTPCAAFHLSCTHLRTG